MGAINHVWLASIKSTINEWILCLRCYLALIRVKKTGLRQLSVEAQQNLLDLHQADENGS